MYIYLYMYLFLWSLLPQLSTTRVPYIFLLYILKQIRHLLMLSFLFFIIVWPLWELLCKIYHGKVMEWKHKLKVKFNAYEKKILEMKMTPLHTIPLQISFISNHKTMPYNVTFFKKRWIYFSILQSISPSKHKRFCLV